MSPDERAVLTANKVFYTAFAGRDAEAMEALWARETAVACIHPGWAPLRDRALILKSWRAIFRGPRSPAIKAEDARVTVVGRVAWVTCYERMAGPDGGEDDTLVATNVFVREDAVWRIAHHQAGPVASPDDEDAPPDPGSQLN